jgi:hypothetical protein
LHIGAKVPASQRTALDEGVKVLLGQQARKRRVVVEEVAHWEMTKLE